MALPRVLVLIVTLVLLGVGSRCWAQEEIADEAPPPASVEESVGPMDRSFVRPFRLLPPRPGFFPWLKEQLKDTPPFFRDTKLDLDLRTFYLNGGNFNGSRSEALATGGSLSYQSGWLLDRLSVGSVLYTSQPLYAPPDRDGTLLLEPGQNGYTVVGQLYARVKILEESFLNLYRYTYDTPYISRHDNRMTPNTFQGYTLTGGIGGKDDGPGLQYGGGYIQKMKGRNDDDFVWMSRVAGASVDRGVGVLGARFTYAGFSIGGIDYYSDDIINIAYGETTYKKTLAGLGVLFSAQYTGQQSVGDNLLMGVPFSANQLGLKVESSYANAVVTFAYTRDGDGADIQTPWSGTPGYTSALVQNFKNAGEQAFLVKGSYDFSSVGLSGLTAYAMYVHGWGTVSPATKAPAPAENEIDFDVQWRPNQGTFKGLWLRFRYGHVKQHQGASGVTDQFQLIINYDFSLL
ncbi:MAG TPA: OprD family outer membrane porin [Candidatus Methylomirabilis sp.]|nr:OprD family outer membrane porin [Candidatus Methylomirabilis sp.]